MTEDKVLIHSEDIYHWGIHGQQWGKRRYQNEDGSLTPLGRIHYGVGEAKERSKIKIREMKAETKSAVKLAKAQAKAAKAVANAEKEKIAAKTKEYRDRKEADNIVELERIKAQREADRMDAKNEAQLNKNLAEASKENAEAEKSSSRAVKTVLGIMAAAGVGYLIYRAASHGEASASTREAAEEAIKKVSDKPVSEVANTTHKYTDSQAKAAIDFYKNKLKNTTDPTEKAVTENFIKQLESSNSITTKASNAIAKAGSSDKNLVNLTLGKVSKSQQAEKAGKQFGDAALQRLEKFKNNVNASNKADAAARVKEAAHQFDIRLAAGNKEYAKNAANASKKVASGFRNMINRNSNKMESFEEWLKNNGKTVFTARHSGMGGKVLIHSGTGIPKDIVICHYGIKGQKRGVRRYQNEDGSYTMAGKYRYGIGTGGSGYGTGTNQDPNKLRDKLDNNYTPKASEAGIYKQYRKEEEQLVKDYVTGHARAREIYEFGKKWGIPLTIKEMQSNLDKYVSENLDKGYNSNKQAQAEAPYHTHYTRQPNGEIIPARNKIRNGEAENSEIGKNMTEPSKTTAAQIIKNKIGDINVPKTTLRDKLSKDSKKPDLNYLQDFTKNIPRNLDNKLGRIMEQDLVKKHLNGTATDKDYENFIKRYGTDDEHTYTVDELKKLIDQNAGNGKTKTNSASKGKLNNPEKPSVPSSKVATSPSNNLVDRINKKINGNNSDKNNMKPDANLNKTKPLFTNNNGLNNLVKKANSDTSSSKAEQAINKSKKSSNTGSAENFNGISTRIAKNINGNSSDKNNMKPDANLNKTKPLFTNNNGLSNLVKKANSDTSSSKAEQALKKTPQPAKTSTSKQDIIDRISKAFDKEAVTKKKKKTEK